MFEGGHRNRERITIPNRNYGVAIKPEPIYRYPEGHPCHGCVFTLKIGNPSCLTGGFPDTINCANAFYRKMQAGHKAGMDKERGVS